MKTVKISKVVAERAEAKRTARREELLEKLSKATNKAEMMALIHLHEIECDMQRMFK